MNEYKIRYKDYSMFSHSFDAILGNRGDEILREGIKTVRAGSGKEALTKFKKQHFATGETEVIDISKL